MGCLRDVAPATGASAAIGSADGGAGVDGRGGGCLMLVRCWWGGPLCRVV